MLGTVLHAPRDVRSEIVPEPRIIHPTDAIIRLSASCVCGSDLRPYRGLNEVSSPMRMGREYCGVVVAVGDAVSTEAMPSADLIPSLLATSDILGTG